MGIIDWLLGRSAKNTIDPRLAEILRLLNEKQVRATYGAVADVIGGIPQSVALASASVGQKPRGS